ncbi:MAG: hypothetical protein IKO26_10455 [Paludibacteraceae bacterium]|nr:hypothetical protein [Paludibacteraceae bacterium]
MKRFLLFLLCLLPIMVTAQIQKVAILETVDREGNISYAIKLMLRSNLAKAITNAPGYEAYDRTDMDAIMGEQNFQRTGLVSDAQIKRLGEMTGASYILVAEAVKVDEQNMFITAKILNVETAKTEVTDNALMGVSASDIQHGCESLANKLLGIGSATVEPSQAQKKTQQKHQQQLQQQRPVTNVAINASGAGMADGLGELYTFADGSKGIVFYKTADGHGLVVSMDVTTAKWENEKKSRNCHDIAALPNEQGIKFMTFQLGSQNTQAIIQALGTVQAPAAAWCTQHGLGWYLPSSGEIWHLFAVDRGEINTDIPGRISTALVANGGVALSANWYWSSTENDSDEAINVSYKGSATWEEKTAELLVRAVRAF